VLTSVDDAGTSSFGVLSVTVTAAGGSFRFPVGMSKGTQLNLLGGTALPNTPDGHMTAGAGTLIQTLNAAQSAHARITVRVTGGNANFMTNNDSIFSLSKWEMAFNADTALDMRPYLRDGTLIGHFAIDEPFAAFYHNMSGALLEQMCQYQKRFPKWRSVPCLVRALNTQLYDNRPAGGYQYVDAGWAQIDDHAYVPPATYNGSMRAYFDSNLVKGRRAGLGLMYGFNLLNGGKSVASCPSPDSQNQCAMTATEVRAVADTLAMIGSNQGCGVNGWQVSSSADSARAYFFSTAPYTTNGIQSALQYLHSKVSGLTPGPCNVRGDLPPP
jgi:hypothetical protein